ncbi:hypothetical protein SmuNN2025_0648 [Streptococcus mutans NN2025]|nr:hypothetical protein SmuNN2025_0648 [Streptococcus mutans NN2025]
MKKVLEK